MFARLRSAGEFLQKKVPLQERAGEKRKNKWWFKKQRDSSGCSLVSYKSTSSLHPSIRLQTNKAKSFFLPIPPSTNSKLASSEFPSPPFRLQNIPLFPTAHCIPLPPIPSGFKVRATASTISAMATQPREQEQGLSSSIAFQAYAFFLTMLGVLIQVKFEGNSASLFGKHNAIISSFVVVISIFTGTIILGKKFEMKTIEPIRLLSGAMAPTLLLLILVPIFGWLLLVLWIFFAAKMGWDYLQQLYLKLFCKASDGPHNPPEEGSQELPVQSPSPPSE